MGGAGWFWKNRGKQRKPLPELSSLIDLTHCRSILPVSAGIITRVHLAWTDDILVIMRRDLSQWVIRTSDTITLRWFDRTWTYQGLAVFWRVLTDPSVRHPIKNSMEMSPSSKKSDVQHFSIFICPSLIQNKMCKHLLLLDVNHLKK